MAEQPLVEAASGLAGKLKLLTLFRLLVAVVFFITSSVGSQDDTLLVTPYSRELMYGALTVLLLLCAVTALLLEHWTDSRRLTLLAFSHFVGDALFATAVVSLTGGIESIFTFLYSLAIINAAIVLFRRGGIFTAAVSTMSLLALAALQAGWAGDTARLLVTPDLSPGLSLESVAPSLTVNILAFFAIAFLSSFLAEQMRHADLRIQEQEAGLEELADLHQSILQSLENGLMTINSSQEIAYVNKTALRLIGFAPADVIGRRVGTIFPDLGPVLDNPDKARRSHSETTIMVHGGRRRYLRWTISPLRNRYDQMMGHVILFIDVTRLKEMEEEVHRAERMAALGRMAANIAHEIRNPLASMSGSIQLLADSIDADGSERKLMNIVVREADHLNRWISEFLEFARPREPVLEEIDFSELVGEVVEMLRCDERARGVELSFQGDADHRLTGDRTRLRQIAWNLALNAVEAVADQETPGHVTISIGTTGGSIILTVHDNGPGIDSELSQRIFEPFFTTKAGGTGLGLAAVHRNVEDHGGSVQVVTDRDGGGTSFVVTLPTNHPAQPVGLETGELTRAAAPTPEQSLGRH